MGSCFIRRCRNKRTKNNKNKKSEKEKQRLTLKECKSGLLTGDMKGVLMKKYVFLHFLQKWKNSYTQKTKKKKKFQTNKKKTMFLKSLLWVVWSVILNNKFRDCIKKQKLLCKKERSYLLK